MDRCTMRPRFVWSTGSGSLFSQQPPGFVLNTVEALVSIGMRSETGFVRDVGHSRSSMAFAESGVIVRACVVWFSLIPTTIFRICLQRRSARLQAWRPQRTNRLRRHRTDTKSEHRGFLGIYAGDWQLGVERCDSERVYRPSGVDRHGRHVRRPQSGCCSWDAP